MAETNQFEARIQGLINRFVYDAGCQCHWYEDPDLFVAWLGNIKESVTDSTFASYRKWLAAYALELGFTEFSESIRAVAAGERGRPARAGGAPHGTEDDIAPKERAAELVEEDMQRLGRVLMSHRGTKERYRHGLIAFSWLMCSSMTGLRPSEWYNAQLLAGVEVDSGDHFAWVLEVEGAAKGAKSSHLKGSEALRRRLILDEFTRSELDNVRLFFAQLPAELRAFASLQESVRQTLRRASAQVFDDPSAVTPNSGRHIFASEVRRSQRYNRYHLAAMLGHSDTINQRYYGDTKHMGTDRRFGFSLAKPWPGSAEAVEAVDRQRYQLRYGKGTAALMEKSGEISFDGWGPEAG